MPDIGCRLAKLEEQVKTLHEIGQERRRHADKTNDLLEEIRNNIQDDILSLKGDISEIKGFRNGMKTGIMMVVGLLSSSITILIDRLFNH